ncbi:PQQ-binding-like beta-propeller repeat protein [Natronomonas sp.]|uniref:PQQ-binding-like beta-propeller repeat protein n=1 Tax=Natronomonas sp. TaxID=2184060 RepID=UPI0026339876|nr:PQQ-binding-like beta-propeller repeat protein [Natronomonas sp.]
MSDRRANGAFAGLERRVELGEIDPCGSRQAGRRSGLAICDAGPVVGRADGGVQAFDDRGTERWRVDGEGSAITLVPFGDGVVVGERSARGAVRYLVEGAERWRHDAADAIGDPTEETRFRLPMVVDAAVGEGTVYAAARRYEREGGERHFESSVYALAPDGSVRWRYDADASPVSLAASDGGVAVAYNRCPGRHDEGLVALGADGSERWTWDPGGGADRRVGDVAALEEGVVATSHADYRGYRIEDGTAVWRVDLGRPREGGDEVYTYPNHAYAGGSGVVFLTGNSFPATGRETEERHPNEQSAFGYTPAGTRRWRADVGGFCHGIAGDGAELLAPVAQHFRERDPSVHGWRAFDTVEGPIGGGTTPGVLTAAALEDGRAAAIEEPVAYHDDGAVRGAYALWL